MQLTRSGADAVHSDTLLANNLVTQSSAETNNSALSGSVVEELWNTMSVICSTALNLTGAHLRVANEGILQDAEQLKVSHCTPVNSDIQTYNGSVVNNARTPRHNRDKALNKVEHGVDVNVEDMPPLL